MTIHKIAGALNGVAALLQGGCKALAEDSKDAFFEVRQAFKAGNVCIMVATPKVTRSASGAPRRWRLLWRAEQDDAAHALHLGEYFAVLDELKSRLPGKAAVKEICSAGEDDVHIGRDEQADDNRRASSRQPRAQSSAPPGLTMGLSLNLSLTRSV